MGCPPTRERFYTGDVDYLALATDYDGTLARDGIVDGPTLQAVKRLRQSGRKVILVTGRELSDLKSVFSRMYLFDLAVCENGGVLYDPLSGELRGLGRAPDRGFIDELASRGVKPLSVGLSIVATIQPFDKIAQAVIRDQALDLQVILNKGSVMVLPIGVNKKTGLNAALAELGIAPQQVVGVGDAENDYAFLEECGWSAAVANALPSLKAMVDFTTTASHGKGVVELIEMILENRLVSPAKG